MARVAVVTGGTRGIGAAISKALKAAGYKVAANYAGNDEAAQQIQGRDRHRRLQMGRVVITRPARPASKQVEAELGPVEVLVNNAGITARRHVPPHDARAVERGDQHQSQFAVQHEPPGDRGHARAQVRPHHQHLLDQRPEGPDRARPTIPPPRPATSASPRRWRRRARAPASPSTPSARAISTPRWCRRCRRTCWRRTSCRRSRSAGSASRRRSRAAWCSSPPTMPGFITGSTLTANGGQPFV